MEQLVREGKVVYLGSSNFAGLPIAEAQGEAQLRNFTGLVCEQSLYTLITPMVELEVTPACQKFGLGLITWRPLEGELLGGVLERELDGRRASEQMQKVLNVHRSKIE